MESIEKKLIKDFSKDEMIELVSGMGLPKFRADQLFNALYVQKISSWDELTTFPKDLREKFSEFFHLNSLKISKVRQSIDGSIKFLYELVDGKSIEAVYMPWFDEDYEETQRITLCISSMVGCPADCKFCATGTMGFGRNLTQGEIVDQVLAAEKHLGKKITNIVFMGMGEPLLNFNNVKKTLGIFMNDDGMNLSRRKITVSTVGLNAKIRHLATIERPPKLAISLHATTNGFRDKIIPLNKNNDIQELMDSIEFYYRQTKIPITYEYIPFKDLNDSNDDAKRLAKIAKRVPSRVNIIPFNDISFTQPQGISAELTPTGRSRIDEFAALVRMHGGMVTVRDTFGSDIEAACGQLALENKED